MDDFALIDVAVLLGITVVRHKISGRIRLLESGAQGETIHLERFFVIGNLKRIT